MKTSKRQKEKGKREKREKRKKEKRKKKKGARIFQLPPRIWPAKEIRANNSGRTSG
jgi:hypothetical protein